MNNEEIGNTSANALVLQTDRNIKLRSAVFSSRILKRSAVTVYVQP